jgi:phosphoadenosine phosphosulfate reductase
MTAPVAHESKALVPDTLVPAMEDTSPYDVLRGALAEYGNDLRIACSLGVEDKYGFPLEVYAPDTVLVENLVRAKGPNSFYRSVDDRRECCGIRKLGPLARALAGARAWVTGLRRDQGPTRADVRVVEQDLANGGLIKLNPLAHWTSDRVWAFVREHRVPTHALHAQGYPSIGCAPCTRAVAEGQDPRAGRWWWEDPNHKECGLHSRQRS